jgi:hypothetical protein
VTVAALYVDPNGVYAGLPDVDLWDEERDARLYDGPWPVVAHPPCSRWCSLAGMIETRYGYRVGDDGGCFALALAAVRKFGGVLDHPAGSLAWRRYGLPMPAVFGWMSSFTDQGYTTQVEQGQYEHPLRKPTWLYAVGVQLPDLRWGVGAGGTLPHRLPHPDYPDGLSATERERMTLPTPSAFRDVLLGMARSAVPAHQQKENA